MPTADRRQFVPQAVRCFLAQDYEDSELLIVDDGADPLADLIPDHPRIRYLRQHAKQRLGPKRNFACDQARGEIIAHWDDDDWSAPWRLRYQVEQLLAANADICGLERVLFYAPREKRAWEYVYPGGPRRWVYGASLCYTKAYWQAHRFPDIHVGEDGRFVWADGQARIHALDDPRFLVAVVHATNTSPKSTSAAPYRPKGVEQIEQLLGVDLLFYQELGGLGAAALTPISRDDPEPDQDIPGGAGIAVAKRSLLVSAALGIGDVLRVTPLIRVGHRLGYDVDLLLATDYPEIVALIEGAPEIRHIFHLPSARCGEGPASIDGLDAREYDVATFTAWSATLRDRVRARRSLAFDRSLWLTEGDSRSVERLARELGWLGEMPAPFAMASSRRFGLPPGAVALHPGCKAEWPWKKWHGFDELARLFPNVVLVGSQEDLRVDDTYFCRPFAWPDHARNFIGQLTLADTAALLRECAALVSNDSGLMHLGAALGLPTFGIFGITSTRREAIPVANFYPITKGLPCETACHAGSWGRRDCERHLECLKTLTAGEVFMKVTEVVPSAAPLVAALVEPLLEVRAQGEAPPTGDHPVPAEAVNLVYYGNIFDASGYGQAARAYIHALHAAGVNVAAVDLGNHSPQVTDPLVESLTQRRIEADFHLFHGIPPYWARRAFPLPNVIAMTVWETDAMPTQWRPTLNHAIDIWLPCEFNVSVFGQALRRPVFKLPHPWLAPKPGALAGWEEGCGIQEGDFVFHSVFEWQERKGPCETIEAFLRAFPDPAPVVLILKSNPEAASVAAAALAETRRRVPSAARVELRCEAWSVEQIEALQERGDCYVSLHRGEGWNCPLFDAACRGKAVVATGFSGPLDYLDPTVHHIVRHQPAPVRQRYAYYSSAMSWANPEVAHAAELMRAAFEARADGAVRAASAERLRSQFSLDAVGHAARERLLQLLRRTNQPKWRRMQNGGQSEAIDLTGPIPGGWYDADYFEFGLKSNWTSGYTWHAFASLFRDTADFLAKSFPEAQSFLDAGCAKGFLIRTLRERGKEAWGFDHSAWAIERAEESARPFLRLGDVETVELGREFDILLSFFLFESLTEAQALAFLQRARPCTRQALVAVIATCENEERRESVARGDRDLSHRRLQSRAWWHELILRAGWRQDPLHRLVERTLQQHPLPKRMAWQMFVYAP